MRKILKAIKDCWYYCWGHLFALFLYDRKYLQGRRFAGKLNGLCSLGWQWVCRDSVMRFITGDNFSARFPVGHGVSVVFPENIIFEPDDLNNFQSYGIYF